MPAPFLRPKFAALLAAAGAFSASLFAAPVETVSPGGRVTIAVDEAATGGVSYSVKSGERTVIAGAPLGMDFGKDGRIPASGWRIAGKRMRSVDTVWKPVWGKRAAVPDRFNETVFELAGSGVFDRLNLVVRAYDDGAAFRYEIPHNAAGAPRRAAGELTGFDFSGDYTAWFFNGENRNLGPDKLSTVKGLRLPVMLVKAADDCYLAVHEADLRAGDPMRLAKSGGTAFRVAGSPGEVKPGYTGAWRAIFAGRRPGDLVDSHLIELLAPEAEGDFSWVKPGVAVWDWRIDGAITDDGFRYKMSLPSWKRMVDFAAAQGLRALVLDADWYGPEFAHDSDPVKGGRADEVQAIIDYGKQKGVGVWLYLNDVGGRKYPLEDTLRKYSEWGASGLKYGFMSGSPAAKNERTRMITALCAKYKLLCDFHDGPVHPYGQMRTFPNAVTREFCWAQLDGKKPGFGPGVFVTSVFVNMLAGPLDMNNGMFDLRQGKSTRVDNNRVPDTTVVAEAARTLIVFSGATILPDIPEFYRKYPELLSFISAEKQPWKESHTLSGVVGEHIVMARQAADGAWLVGAATDEHARTLSAKLDFLGPGSFEAVVCEDGDDADFLKNRESWKHRVETVTRDTTLTLKLAPGGGACVLIRPKTK